MQPHDDFDLLQVKASIAPQAETWPSPDFSKTTITGEIPHMECGDPHWSALHDAVFEARDRVLKALGRMSAVDDDKSLSPTGKTEKKRAIAVIPPKANRKTTRTCDFVLYCERNLIERFFNKLKHFRGIATRYDKLARNFLAAVQLVGAIILLN